MSGKEEGVTSTCNARMIWRWILSGLGSLLGVMKVDVPPPRRARVRQKCRLGLDPIPNTKRRSWLFTNDDFLNQK